MLRNVEIKARVRNPMELKNNAKILSQSDGELIPQRDVFFNCSVGRLKMRTYQDGSASLLFYNRPDQDGPKLCQYEKCDLPAGDKSGSLSEKISSILTNSAGVRGKINKVRHLFLVGQTRVHIDDVEGLGTFMELEVVLREDQTPEEGQSIAEDLMKKLGVLKEDLIAGAYMDMVEP